MDHSTDTIKLNIKIPRTTLILRNISSLSEHAVVLTWVQEKTAHLNTQIVELIKELADNWFVTFPDEAITISAFRAFQDQQFNEKPIKVEVKSDTLLRSVNTTSTVERNESKIELSKPFIIGIKELQRDSMYSVHPQFT